MSPKRIILLIFIIQKKRSHGDFMAVSHGPIRHVDYSSKHEQPCSERTLRMCFRNIRKGSFACLITSYKTQSPSLQETQLIFGELNYRAFSLWWSGCQLTWKRPEGHLQGLSMFCVWMEIRLHWEWPVPIG